MDDKIIQLGQRITEQARERFPEFQFEIRYTQEGKPNDNVTGFLTGMGAVYFIGTGLKPTDREASEVDWIWSAPMDQVQSIISRGPSQTTKRLDA